MNVACGFTCISQIFFHATSSSELCPSWFFPHWHACLNVSIWGLNCYCKEAQVGSKVCNIEKGHSSHCELIRCRRDCSASQARPWWIFCAVFLLSVGTHLCVCVPITHTHTFMWSSGKLEQLLSYALEMGMGTRHLQSGSWSHLVCSFQDSKLAFTIRYQLLSLPVSMQELV